MINNSILGQISILGSGTRIFDCEIGNENQGKILQLLIRRVFYELNVIWQLNA